MRYLGGIMLKLKVILLILVILCGFTSNVFANNIANNIDSNSEWWSSAHFFLGTFKGKGTAIGTSTVGEIIGFLDPLVDLIKFVGNAIFIIVTVILGIKYIWGGVESKASVKDSLATLVVSALFFYGWTTITALVQAGSVLSFVQSSFTSTVSNIYATIMYVCNYLAIGGIIYIGIRYMLAGAEGKATLKAKSVPIVLGILMVYGTLTFLNFIVSFI